MLSSFRVSIVLVFRGAVRKEAVSTVFAANTEDGVSRRRAKRGRFDRFRGVHRGSGVFFSPALGTKPGPALGTKTVDFLPNLH